MSKNKYENSHQWSKVVQDILFFFHNTNTKFLLYFRGQEQRFVAQLFATILQGKNLGPRWALNKIEIG